VRVPILNGNNPTSATTDPRTMRPAQPQAFMTREQRRKGLIQTASQTIKKPGRQLGGCYISDKAENRGSVKLCDGCVKKYWGFWKQSGHRPSWNNYFTSDCDGCGESWMLVILFLPQDLFSKVLGGSHGRFSSPRRTVFRWPWQKTG